MIQTVDKTCTKHGHQTARTNCRQDLHKAWSPTVKTWKSPDMYITLNTKYGQQPYKNHGQQTDIKTTQSQQTWKHKVRMHTHTHKIGNTEVYISKNILTKMLSFTAL